MKTCDLSGPTGKLQMGLQALHEACRDVEESWNDETYRRFQETYTAPLEPQVKNLLDAVRRLAQTLAAAEQQCSDREHG